MPTRSQQPGNLPVGVGGGTFLAERCLPPAPSRCNPRPWRAARVPVARVPGFQVALEEVQRLRRGEPFSPQLCLLDSNYHATRITRELLVEKRVNIRPSRLEAVEALAPSTLCGSSHAAQAVILSGAKNLFLPSNKPQLARWLAGAGLVEMLRYAQHDPMARGNAAGDGEGSAREHAHVTNDFDECLQKRGHKLLPNKGLQLDGRGGVAGPSGRKPILAVRKSYSGGCGPSGELTVG